jgi:predicted nucleic acid-binding protein
MILVFNASPVIVLAKAGLLETILQLGDSLLIPKAVIDEVLRVDDVMDPARLWFEGSGAPFERIPTPSTPPFLAAWDLGRGESAVIAIASPIPGAVAVLDDLAGRRCAQAHGIPIIGTLGLILLAKKRGLLPSASAAIMAVTRAGLYVSAAAATEIRAKAGE